MLMFIQPIVLIKIMFYKNKKLIKANTVSLFRKQKSERFRPKILKGSDLIVLNGERRLLKQKKTITPIIFDLIKLLR